MKFKKELIMFAVLLVSTAIFTIFIYIPETKVNTSIEVVLEAPVTEAEASNAEEDDIDLIQTKLSLEDGKTATHRFSFLNRDLPENWKDRELFLKYTYISQYGEDTVEKINEMLINEYSWRNQLDKEGNVVFNGPLLYKEDTYQLYVHNTLYQAQRYYLLGDVLDMLWKKDELVGTRIEISDLQLEAVWVQDLKVWEDSTLKNSADLIISTCLERNGDWRLVVGFNIID